MSGSRNSTWPVSSWWWWKAGPAGDARDYRGSGSAWYHPSVVLSILVYGYATGVFSRRKSDRRSVTHHASAGGGFEQGYNALAAMAADSLLVVAIDPGLRP
jgi:hypothetical protein